MAVRLRKTRKLRGSRTHGWGQVGQHRASGHKGGVGVAGQLKHHFSSMLKENPDHFGHDSSRPPKPSITKKWLNVRDLDDAFVRLGTNKDGRNVIDLAAGGYDKLLGGGWIRSSYTVLVPKFTEAAAKKVADAGGEVQRYDG